MPRSSASTTSRDLEAAAPAQLAALPGGHRRAARPAAPPRDQAAARLRADVRRRPRPRRSTATSRRRQGPRCGGRRGRARDARSSAPGPPRAWSRSAGRRRRWPVRPSWSRRSSGSPRAWTMRRRDSPPSWTPPPGTSPRPARPSPAWRRCPQRRLRRPGRRTAGGPGRRAARPPRRPSARRDAPPRHDPSIRSPRSSGPSRRTRPPTRSSPRSPMPRPGCPPPAGRRAAIATAQGHVSGPSTTSRRRRHGVGETARTRAAEAEVRLEEARALAAANPEGATATANRAIQLADEAYRLAAGEFEGWNRGGGPVAGPYRPQGAGAEVIGAVVGGILGAVISGAARGGGGPRQRLGWQPVGRRGRRIDLAGGFGLPGGGGGGRSRGGGFSMPSGRRRVRRRRRRWPRPRRALVGRAHDLEGSTDQPSGPRDPIDLDAIGRTPWRRPRSSGVSDSSSVRTSTRCSTRPRTRRRCWTS